jgi:DNA polymerase-3 subunit beta
MSTENIEFVAGRQDLVRCLERVVPAAADPGKAPHLTHVLLEAEAGGMVRLSATNLEIRLATGMAATVASPGAIGLPAKTMLEAVRSLSGDEVAVVGGITSARLRSGQRSFHLAGLHAEDFPASADLPVDLHRICAVDLRDLVQETGHAMCREEDLRPRLAGALLEIGAGRMGMVATDGSRLAWAWKDCPGASAGRFLLPHRAVAVLGELCRDLLSGEGPPPVLEMGAKDRRVFFVWIPPPGDGPRTVLTTVQMEDGFPAWRQAIPGEAIRRVRVPRLRLLETLQVLAVLADDRMDSTSLAVGGRSLVVSLDKEGRGAFRDVVDAETTGPGLVVGVDRRYLVGMLEAIRADEVLLGFGEALDPLKITPAGADGFVGVIMPRRL